MFQYVGFWITNKKVILMQSSITMIDENNDGESNPKPPSRSKPQSNTQQQ